MAISTLSYFSNSIQGIPQIGTDIDLYESRTSPKFAIGYRIQRQDGAEFVYAQFGATTGQGMLVSQDLSESSLVDTDDSVIAPASCVTITDGTAGQKFLQLTLAAVTANQYAGGYLAITDDSGEGHQYRIKGNDATDNTATGDIRIELHDKLVVALDATSDVSIVGNLYANLEPSTTTDIAVAGVSVVAQAAADFGWVQVEGIAQVLTDGTNVIGSGCIIAATAGAVAPAVETDILERIGVCIVVGDDTGYSQLKLTL
jgi:hypothetical protein